MKTKRDISSATRGGLKFTIPAGSPVEPAKLSPDGVQRYWVKPFVFERNSIERHDATYYGVEVSAEDVEP